MRGKDLQGQKFGRLTVIARMPPIPGSRNAMWNCHCDCGKYAVIAAANIGTSTFSCGCLAKESASKMASQNRVTKHGMTGTPEYQAWTKMKLRCYDHNDKKYKDYGARGISVCERWRNSFENFIADVGRKPSSIHSIGRINNDGDYEPSNCRWELPVQQARNARFNRIVTIDGISLCVAAWCEQIGISRFRPYELTRATGRKRDGPPRCGSIDEAVEVLYREWQSP